MEKENKNDVKVEKKENKDIEADKKVKINVSNQTEFSNILKSLTIIILTCSLILFGVVQLNNLKKITSIEQEAKEGIYIIKSKSEYDKLVKNGEGLILSIYAKEDCPECIRFKPVVEEYKMQNKDVLVYEIDVDEDFGLEILKDENLNTVPSYKIYFDGKVVTQERGYKNLDFLKKFIESAKEMI